MPTTIPYRMIGGILLAVAVAAFIALSLSWRTRLIDRDATIATTCAATRAASGVTKLDCKQVPQQIAFMGQAIGTLKDAITKQNAAVAALGEQSKQKQAEAAKALQAAQGRAQSAEATARRLEAGSHAVAHPGEPGGQFSKAFEEQWP